MIMMMMIWVGGGGAAVCGPEDFSCLRDGVKGREARRWQGVLHENRITNRTWKEGGV